MLLTVLYGGQAAKNGPALLVRKTSQIPERQSLLSTLLEEMDDDDATFWALKKKDEKQLQTTKIKGSWKIMAQKNDSLEK